VVGGSLGTFGLCALPRGCRGRLSAGVAEGVGHWAGRYPGDEACSRGCRVGWGSELRLLLRHADCRCSWRDQGTGVMSQRVMNNVVFKQVLPVRDGDQN